MPDLSINTQAAAYTNRQAQWANVKAALQVAVPIWIQLTPPERQAWLQRDPLLRDILLSAKQAADLLGAVS